MAELVDHIVRVYHEPLVLELPRLEQLARDARDDEKGGGVVTAEVLETIGGLRAELIGHMRKEETILFPWICGGGGTVPAGPIGAMRAEHVDALRRLDQLSGLTDGFSEPRDAGRALDALLDALRHLDASLREHIRLENDVLFERIVPI